MTMTREEKAEAVFIEFQKYARSLYSMTELREAAKRLVDMLCPLPDFARHSREIERQIVVKLVDNALGLGYAVTVNDGEATVLEESTDRTAIFAAMGTTNEEILSFVKREDGQRFGGWVYLLYGNDADVISDYVASQQMEEIVKPALALAEKLAG